jgi:hypothetical protein
MPIGLNGHKNVFLVLTDTWGELMHESFDISILLTKTDYRL